MALVSASGPRYVKALRCAFLAGLIGSAAPAGADKPSPTALPPLQTIVVTAKKRPESLADIEVRMKLETALHSDPLFYDAHVTISVENGVVRLQGIVFDEWDLRLAKRISKRIAGVRRVVDEFEIKLGGE